MVYYILRPRRSAYYALLLLLRFFSTNFHGPTTILLYILLRSSAVTTVDDFGSLFNCTFRRFFLISCLFSFRIGSYNDPPLYGTRRIGYIILYTCAGNGNNSDDDNNTHTGLKLLPMSDGRGEAHPKKCRPKNIVILFEGCGKRSIHKLSCRFFGLSKSCN